MPAACGGSGVPARTTAADSVDPAPGGARARACSASATISAAAGFGKVVRAARGVDAVAPGGTVREGAASRAAVCVAFP